MGWIIVYGYCFTCKRVFAFNPHKVPSIRVSETDRREPLCLDCMTLVNEKRQERGLRALPIHPEAYESCPEHEL